MSNNILIAIDLASSIEHIGPKLEVARRLADPQNTTLVLLHVVEELPGSLNENLPSDYHREVVVDAEARLKAIAKEHGLAGGVKTLVRSGTPYRTVLEVADELKPEVILVSSHKHSMSDFLLGSVASRIVRHAECSVFVHRTTNKNPSN